MSKGQLELARQVARFSWTDKRVSHIDMIPDLAEVFAEHVANLADLGNIDLADYLDQVTRDAPPTQKPDNKEDTHEAAALDDKYN